MPHITDEDISPIVGAFFVPDPALFRVLLQATGDELGGDLAELGVSFGRSAVLVGDFLQREESFTVIDLFETEASDAANSAENAESYPGLTQEAFETNYLSLHSRLPKVVRGPSEEILNHVGEGTHRFVHVDASHLYQHVLRDIESAKIMLKPDGVIVLDDYRAEHSPGVAAAAWQAVTQTGMRPFALSPSKMYATWGDPGPWQRRVAEWADRAGASLETQVINEMSILRVSSPTSSAAPHPLRPLVPPALWPHLRRLSALRRRTMDS